jgi:hypothetical protein
MQLVNTKILSHPLNWAIVFMMLLIAAIAGHEALSLAGIEPAS